VKVTGLCLLLPIDLPPVADLDDLNDPSLIVDRVDDAVISLADAVPFLPGELFVAGESRKGTPLGAEADAAGQSGI
jgi:hypothetical protein